MNATFSGPAFLAALNPELFAVDLLLIRKGSAQKAGAV